MPKYFWEDLNKWGKRMANRYDGVVWDNELERRWDWGQALCRELYGPDWMNSEEFKADNEATYPSEEIMQRAFDWEKDIWPEWAESLPELAGFESAHLR
jgi:hypothetical protein